MRASLMRLPYRRLLDGGRAYAAFTEADLRLLDEFLSGEEILDPTSGYGVMTRRAVQLGFDTYCVEMNPPQYLWQYLTKPDTRALFKELAARSSSAVDSVSVAMPRALVSTEWLPRESKDLLIELFDAIHEVCRTAGADNEIPSEIAAIALLLPFGGRLSACVAGDITHVKRGGICVYEGWKEDYKTYCDALVTHIERVEDGMPSTRHELVLGDARVEPLPLGRFRAMLTSPPYPNRSDYGDMFRPERAILDFLTIENRIPPMDSARSRLIGTNTVKGEGVRVPRGDAANRFLDAGDEQEMTDRAKYDWNVYYRPYFMNYFCDIEDLYANVATSLAAEFKGYVIVANNTRRKLTVPVDAVIAETWESLGFHVSTYETREAFHVGTKNPRARGHKARHATYALEIVR